MFVLLVYVQSVVVQQCGLVLVVDLVEGLFDVVVNILILQDVEGSESDSGLLLLKVQKDVLFEQYFNDYFNKWKKDGGKNCKVNLFGFGFVIDLVGFIVINNYVIEGVDEIDVNFVDGMMLEVKLIGIDMKMDFVVLKVELKVLLKVVKFGDFCKMWIGDWVMVVGNLFGFGGMVMVGIVLVCGWNINVGFYDNFIQMDVVINKGNFGGLFFNMEGDVIGVNMVIILLMGGLIGIGFLIFLEIVMNVIQQLKIYGEMWCGWFGVCFQLVMDDMVKMLGLDKMCGVLVLSVIVGGFVENGLIKFGDVILFFDG